MSCICDIPQMALAIKNTYPHMMLCPCCLKRLPETCTDEDGNLLIVERIPSKPKDGKPSPKPMSMAIDLDNINIDREVHILEEAGGEKPWMTEYIRKRQIDQIKEYLKEKKKGD